MKQLLQDKQVLIFLKNNAQSRCSEYEARWRLKEIEKNGEE